jgi:hypothetical protein
LSVVAHSPQTQPGARLRLKNWAKRALNMTFTLPFWTRYAGAKTKNRSDHNKALNRRGQTTIWLNPALT